MTDRAPRPDPIDDVPPAAAAAPPSAAPPTVAEAEAAELFEMSLDNLCVAGLDGYLRRVNPSWTRTLGWTAAELMARPSIELVHPDDRAAVLAARERLADGQPVTTLTNRYRCKDGSYRWLEWRSVMHPERGVVYAAARDVTEQRRDQRALAELGERLAATLDGIADGVIATDAAGLVARMNPVAERLTGWASADAVGRPLAEVFALLDVETGAATVLPPPASTTATEPRRPMQLRGRDGQVVPVAGRAAPMTGQGGAAGGVVLVFHDMTAEHEARAARDELQRQRVFADRMTSVGTLAAGVAHEINNPLAYVMGNLDMLAEELRAVTLPPALRGEWSELVRDAREGTERIRTIVRGLRTFARADEDRRALVDLTAVLALAVDLTASEVRGRARLVLDLGPLPLVVGDDARLGQVFINLLVNAAQAIGDGDAEAHEIRIVARTDADRRAVVEVHDTGPGIPAETIGRVFDPFFTTKPVGVGTGLGLSVCHSIVTGLGGAITAHARPGGGAIVRVVLPGELERSAGPK